MKFKVFYISFLPVILFILASCTTAQTYQLTFDTQGGSEIIAIESLDSIAIPRPDDPIREGYVFDDWYYNLSYTEVVTWPIELSANTTIYAKWTDIRLTLDVINETRDFGDVFITGYEDTTLHVFEGDTFQIEAESFTGYYFLGWYINDVLVSTETTYTIVIPDTNITIYGVFVVDDLLVLSFETDGGDPIEDIYFKMTDDPITQPEVPTRQGYMFNGWYADEEHTEPIVWPLDIRTDYVAYADWVALDLKLTVASNDINQGIVSITSFDILTPEITVGNSVELIATANEGYSFVGWMLNDSFISNETPYVFTMPTYEVVVTAYFEAITYTISFETFEGCEVDAISQTTLNESLFEPEEPVYDAHVFIGWYLTDTFEGNPVSWPYTPLSDVTLYAKWEWASYELTIIANDDTYGFVSITGYDALTLTIQANTEFEVSAFSYDGYHFSYWITDENNVSHMATNIFIMPSHDMTLIAEFVSDVIYTVFFECNGGTMIDPISQSEENAAIMQPEDPVKIDAVFSGWYLDQSFTQMPINWPYVPYENLTLYAKWDIITYSLNFDLRTMDYKPSIIASPSEWINEPEEPTEDNREFVGWFYDYTYTQPVSWPLQLSENTTVYAKWEAKVYKITFDSVGGSDISAIQLSTPNYVDEPTVPEKENYAFDGWYLDENYSELVTWPFYLDDEITVYAHWIDTLYYDALFAYRLDEASQTASIVFLIDNSVTILTIPETFEGYTVTKIESNAFNDANLLQLLIIPSTIETIELNAFSGVTNLEQLTIPFLGNTRLDTNALIGKIFSNTSVTNYYEANNYYIPNTLTGINITDATYISEYALKDASSLTEITISNSVQTISRYAFSGTSALTYLEVPFIGTNRSANSSMARLGYVFDNIAYDNSYYADGYYLPNGLSEIIVTDTTIIGDSAFAYMTSLVTIQLPGNLINIGTSAFQEATSLIAIDIPSTVESIGDYAFNGATHLETVTIAEDAVLSIIGHNTFGYTTALTSFIIPENVTAISDYTFLASGITSIVIPSNVQTIGYGAFRAASNLSSITFADNSGLLSIDGNAFAALPYLTEITIPNSVTDMGLGVFIESYHIETLYVPFIGQSRTATGDEGRFGYIFGDYTYGLGTEDDYYLADGYYLPKQLTTVYITDATNMSDQAFFMASYIETIYLSEDISSIGDNVFIGMTALQTIIVDSNNLYYTYDNGGLYNNDFTTLVVYPAGQAITTLTIPNSVIDIQIGALSGLNTLESISVPFVGANRSATGSQAYFGYAFGTYTYENSRYALGYYIPSLLTEITITDATTIGDYAFLENTAIESISLSNQLESIGVASFAGMENLVSVTFEADSILTTIGISAFANNMNLTSITIPRSVTTIEDYAFSGMSQLTEILFESDSSLALIGSYAFAYNTQLQYIEIPQHVTSLSDYMFAYSSQLLTVDFAYGSELSSLGTHVFDQTSITQLNLPNTLETMAYGSLSGMSALIYLDIPFVGGYQTATGTDAILGYLFGDTTNTVLPSSLKHINITSALTIEKEAFADATALESITLNDGIISIGENAFYQTSITELVIPDSVEMIAYAAFNNMSNLALITLPFVGVSREATGTEAIFGYVFGKVGTSSVGFSYANGYHLPSGLTHVNITDADRIANAAFYGVSTLTSITLPFIGASLEATGEAAQFGYIFSTGTVYYGDLAHTYYISSDFTSVTILNATQVADYAFYKVSEIENLVLPNTITTIGDYAFNGMTSLVETTITSLVSSIGDYAFEGDTSLTSITFEESSALLTIGAYAFANTSAIVSLNLPDRITSFGHGVLAGMSSLHTLSIPFLGTNRDATGVEARLEYLFSNESYDNSYTVISYKLPLSLTDLTITDATQIHDYALNGASSLTYISLNNNQVLLSIGDYAFSRVSNIISLDIPDSVLTIGEGAFSQMTNLSSINIQETSQLESIGNSILNESSQVDYFYIPANVSSISRAVFFNAVGLSQIVVDSNNTVYTSVDNVLYDIDMTTLYAYPAGQTTTSFTIPNSVATIAQYAFNHTKLTTISIPDTVTIIESYTFFHAEQVTTINIPNQLMVIEQGVFSYMTALTSISIPDSVVTIESRAFYANTNLVNIIFLGESSVQTIGNAAFGMNSALTSITLPSSLETIGSEILYGTAISALEIPISVTDIEVNALAGLSSLTTLSIPFLGSTRVDYSNNVLGYVLGSVAYDNSYAAGDYYIPNGLVSIHLTNAFNVGKKAFYGVTSVTDLVITGDILNINNYAFYGMTNLLSITIENNTDLTFIGNYAFAYLISLPELTIPDTVTTIQNYAFLGDSSITNLTVPTSVMTIGLDAFSGMTNLEQITIPFIGNHIDASDDFDNIYYLFGASVPERLHTVIITKETTISSYAFDMVNYIEYLYLPETLTTIEFNGFWKLDYLKEIIMDSNNENFTSVDGVLYNKNLTTLVKYPSAKTNESFEVPYTVTAIEKYAFSNVSSLKYVTFEAGTTIDTIDEYAFANAGSLESIIIPSTVTTIASNAFSYSQLLQSITFESGTLIDYISENAFYNTTSLTSIILPSSVTTVEVSAFNYNANLTIYAEAVTTPSGWATGWEDGCTVVWGYTSS